jgi:hypothetical protein
MLNYLDVNVDGVGVPDIVRVDVGDGGGGDGFEAQKLLSDPEGNKQTNERVFTRVYTQQLAVAGG